MGEVQSLSEDGRFSKHEHRDGTHQGGDRDEADTVMDKEDK